jgi:hypothetical protein
MPAADDALWQALCAMFEGRPEIVRGKCFGAPSLFYVDPDAPAVKGKRPKRHLFAFIYCDAVGIKLTPEMVDELLGEEGFAPFTPYGMGQMKNWVLLTPESPESLSEHEELLETALAMVSG